MLYHVGYSVGIDSTTRQPTKLIFTINIPTTSGFEMVVRYLVSSIFTYMKSMNIHVDRSKFYF